MRRVRQLLLTLMAIFALGAVVATTASATEAGFLPLEAIKGALKFKGTTPKEVIFKVASGEFKCKKATATGELGGKAGEEIHIVLGVVTYDYEECKITKGEAKIACNTAGDPKETILVKYDIHLINVLKEKELEPGIAFTFLENLKITCGIIKAEMKGSMLGLVLDPTGLLVKDTELIEDHLFVAGEKCDTAPGLDEELCLKFANDPFLVKMEAEFEKATVEALLHYIMVNVGEMFLVDD
jgi:hypothetical protein